MTDCIFCKIVAGELPARKVYEDDQVVAFHDIKPMAQTHLLIVPNKHIESLWSADATDQALLGHILLLAPRLAREQGLDDGFRTMINTGHGGGQIVFHLHVHIFGGGDSLPHL